MAGKTLKIVDSNLALYLEKVKKIKLLTAEEEYNLAIDWYQHGNEEAAKVLLISHLPLVVKVAFSFKGYGQPMVDLISEGNLGLMRAIYKFDPRKGFRLATYAIWWIRAYITEYILNSFSLVKSGSTQGRRKLFFSLKKLKKQLGITTQNISDQHVKIIADKLNVSPNDINAVNDMIEHRDVSLELQVFGDKGSSGVTFADLVSHPGDSPEEVVINSDEVRFNSEVVHKVMDSLNDREKFIIEQRFFLDKPRSLSDIGAELNISRERVRQLESRVLQKAKHLLAPPESKPTKSS